MDRDTPPHVNQENHDPALEEDLDVVEVTFEGQQAPIIVPVPNRAPTQTPNTALAQQGFLDVRIPFPPTQRNGRNS